MRVRELAAGDDIVAAAVRLTWLGQAGFVLRHAEITVVIDPYLSDSLADKYRGMRYPHIRMAPAPIDARSLADADVVLCTHRHTDHMDPQTLTVLAEVSTCRFVAPAAWTGRMVGFGIAPERIAGAVEGQRLQLSELTVDPVLAAHETIERDEAGHSLHLGYVLTLGRIRLYHSGDCVPYPGQVETLRPLDVDVAMLPVNGRDPARTSNGVPGNFHPAEAVALAPAIGARLLIAHHFGMFDFNTVNQAALDAALATLDPTVGFLQPTVGASYEVSKDA